MSKELAKTGGGEIARQTDVEESAQVARAQAEIQAALVVADRRPRDEDKVWALVKKSVERPAFAKTAFYTYPRGGKEIFGPSVNLAREIGRRWGNIRSGFHVYDSADGQRIIQAAAWDLETNAHGESQDCFRKLHQRKDPKTGVTSWIQPDERDLRELTERRAAIQVRNCILRLLPRDKVNEMVADSRKTVKGKQAGLSPEEKKSELLAGFDRLGIYAEQIEAYCQYHFSHGLADTTADERTELTGIGTAIKDGTSKRDEYFPKKREPKAEPLADEDENPMNLDDIAKAEVVSEADPHAEPEPEMKFPAVVVMRTEISRVLKRRLGDLGTVESFLKSSAITEGQGDISLIKGEMLKALYRKEVRHA